RLPRTVTLAGHELVSPERTKLSVSCLRRASSATVPVEVTRTADVSPPAVTFCARKLLIFFVDSQNRTQEADGSIPFISTKSLLFFPTRGSAVTKFCESLPLLGGRARLFRGGMRLSARVRRRGR